MNSGQDKAIIVGATSGIGREVAMQLLNEGWTLGICGRREERLKEIRMQYPGKVFTQVLDITSDDAPLQLYIASEKPLSRANFRYMGKYCPHRSTERRSCLPNGDISFFLKMIIPTIIGTINTIRQRRTTPAISALRCLPEVFVAFDTFLSSFRLLFCIDFYYLFVIGYKFIQNKLYYRYEHKNSKLQQCEVHFVLEKVYAGC